MKPSERDVIVNSRKYDGELKRSWRVRPVRITADLLCFIGVFAADVLHPELGLIRRGTTSHEFFWPDKWFNIFRFQEPDGSLRCYYVNIIMPPQYDGRILDYVDLDIDILVAPELSYRILDEQEFEDNIRILNYSPMVVETAKITLTEIVEIIKSGRFPAALLRSETENLPN